jgi:hypothetical protein
MALSHISGKSGKSIRRAAGKSKVMSFEEREPSSLPWKSAGYEPQRRGEFATVVFRKLSQ